MEGSPYPQRTLKSANRLRVLAPGAAHLVHMCAHTYVHTGLWNDASKCNIYAMKVVAAYNEVFPDPVFRDGKTHYPYFEAFTAAMRGRQEESLRYAREMVSIIPEDFINQNASFMDGMLNLPLNVLMRFGKWEDILAEPEPAQNLPLSRALRHYVRAAALNSIGRSQEAEEERATFRKAAADVPSNWTIDLNSAADIF